MWDGPLFPGNPYCISSMHCIQGLAGRSPGPRPATEPASVPAPALPPTMLQNSEHGTEGTKQPVKLHGMHLGVQLRRYTRERVLDLPAFPM